MRQLQQLLLLLLSSGRVSPCWRVSATTPLPLSVHTVVSPHTARYHSGAAVIRKPSRHNCVPWPCHQLSELSRDQLSATIWSPVELETASKAVAIDVLRSRHEYNILTLPILATWWFLSSDNTRTFQSSTIPVNLDHHQENWSSFNCCGTPESF